MHDRVIGRIEPLALETVGDHGDLSVMFGPCHPSGAMFACDQPALAVAGVAIAVVRRLPKCGDAAAGSPTQDSIVRNVGEKQAARIAEPDRPFDPVKPGGELFDRSVAQNETVEDGVIGLKEGHSAAPGFLRVVVIDTISRRQEVDKLTEESGQWNSLRACTFRPIEPLWK